MPRKTNNIPPGPKRQLLIGNLWDFPRSKEWLDFTKWGRQYGDILSLSTMNRSIIILRSFEDCSELLQKRYKIYSDRPHLVMCGELIGWKDAPALQPYCPRLRQMRRLIHQALLLDHSSLQEKEAVHFLARVLSSPENVFEHVRHRSNSLILKLVYGYTISDSNDPIAIKAEEATHSFMITSTPGAYLVDTIPWLKYIPAWFPGAGFQHQAKKWRNLVSFMVNNNLALAKAQIEGKSSTVPSFTSIQLAKKLSPQDEEVLKWTAGGTHAAAIETTNSVFFTILLTMALYPEIQRKAQAEIDNVTGCVRLPKSSDRSSLPYVEAIMKESFRIIPPVPLGVPHLLIQEDHYKEYRFPQGSVVITNIWAMSRNEDYFPEPEKFNPDRYLSIDKSSFAANPERFIFGFGRRICPGQKLAESTIFLTLAMFLAVFKVENARDTETGKPIQAGVWDTTAGTVIQPKPFLCNISPRSKQTAKMIEEATAKELSAE